MGIDEMIMAQGFTLNEAMSAVEVRFKSPLPRNEAHLL